MFRIILIALIVYAIFSLWRKVRRRTATHNVSGNNLPPGEMVACEECGTFILKTEAVETDGHWYCADTCRTSRTMA